MTTETVVADLRGYFKAAGEAGAGPAGPAAQAAPAAAIAAPAVTPAPAGAAAPGQEPSPGAAAPAAASPTSPILEEQDDAALQSLAASQQWPKHAIDTVTKLRASRRELKTTLELERDAEKQRADALAEQLKQQGQVPKQGQQGEPQQPPAESTRVDGLEGVPEVREARKETQLQAHNFQFANRMLRTLETQPEGVVAELKKHGLNLEGKPVEEVRASLEWVRDEALLKHNAATSRAAMLEQEATQQISTAKEAFNRQAYEFMPALKDPKSAEFAEAQKALKAFPWLQNDPRGMRVIAAMIAGHKVMLGQAGQAAGAAPVAQAAPVAAAPLPGLPASLPPAQPAGDETEALKQKFFKSGLPEDRTAWMRSMLKSAAA